jgi:hypothetical protein
MNIRELLSTTVSRSKIQRIVHLIEEDSTQLKTVYNLIFEENIQISWRAVWVCLKVSEKYPEAFIPKQQELINFLLNTEHEGKKRLLLSIQLNLPIPNPFSVPLLDFVLGIMFDPNEKSGIQSAAIKLGYKLSQVDSDLLQEYKLRLQEIDLHYYSPAINSSVNSILKQINK